LEFIRQVPEPGPQDQEHTRPPGQPLVQERERLRHLHSLAYARDHNVGPSPRPRSHARSRARRPASAPTYHHPCRSISLGLSFTCCFFACTSVGSSNSLISATPATNPPTCAQKATPPPAAGRVAP